ncbi:MAG TPA: cache domain-containing protein, partial [Burkholderiaceae bacterium]|nr:cache domain-containing protein [Burkholderiaceae bacterium]
MVAGTGWWRRSIGARVIALFLGLLLAIQVVSFTALRGSLTRHARHELPARVAEGERLLQTLLDRRAQTLLGGARVLASDYGFRAALASNDNQTIVSVLSNHGARIGATVSALLASDFTLRSATSSTPQAIVPLIQRLVAQAATEGTGDAIALVDGHPIQAVLVPVKAPRTIGWVLMGFPLDAQVASDLHGLSGLDLTLLQRRTVDDPWHPAASSAEGALAIGLGGISPRQAAPPSSRTTAIVNGEEYVVATVPLDNARTTDGVDGVLGLLSLSVDAAVKLPL